MAAVAGTLRVSVENPQLRIILTVSEGLYRLVGRRSAGIASIKDLKGKRIATVPNTSSAFFLHKLLALGGLTEADVTVVPMFPLEKMTPALKAGEVDAVTIWEPEIQRSVEAEGLSIIRTLVGHGIGREMHEEPQVPNFGEPGKGPELEEGMVLAIEPMVNVGGPLVRMDDDGWSVFSEDGSLAAHFEFTVAVTADGPRVLTPWHEAE